MYRCSGCNGTMSYPHEKCPHCGVILSGIHCESCGHTDTKNAFIKNDNRCPICNSRVVLSGSTQKESESFSEPLKGLPSEPFTDLRDGKVYKTVRIGKQVWMAENLAYIPHVSPPSKEGGIWVYGYKGSKKSIFGKRSEGIIADAVKKKGYIKYGCLYDWNTAQDIAPEGWRLPSVNDFEILINNSGEGKSYVYKSLIQGGVSGFSALFGGLRWEDGVFIREGEASNFWSSDEFLDSTAYCLVLYEDMKKGFTFDFDVKRGLSVRCILDQGKNKKKGRNGK